MSTACAMFTEFTTSTPRVALNHVRSQVRTRDFRDPNRPGRDWRSSETPMLVGTGSGYAIPDFSGSIWSFLAQTPTSSASGSPLSRTRSVPISTLSGSGQNPGTRYPRLLLALDATVCRCRVGIRPVLYRPVSTSAGPAPDTDAQSGRPGSTPAGTGPKHETDSHTDTSRPYTLILIPMFPSRIRNGSIPD